MSDNVERCFETDIYIHTEILMKLGYSRQIFEKYSNIKFHENPSSGSRVIPCGLADGVENR